MGMRKKPLISNQIKSIASMIIVALTSGVSRPLSIMNYECNVSFLRYDNLEKKLCKYN